jgi:hypothetical protein
VTLTPYPWRVLVRNGDLEIVGELDDYQSLDMQLKFNDVSKWSITIDRRNRLASALIAPGGGIIVTRDGETVLSGDSDGDRSHQRDAGTNKLTINGSDDTVWLKTRQAHPQPSSTAPPYSTTAEHVVTGIASSAMAVFVVFDVGPAAPVVGRRKLAGYTDAGFGTSGTWRGRWQPLLTLFQEIATASPSAGIPCGFRIVQQVGVGLWFETYRPVDRTDDVIFSFGRENLLGIDYRHTPPEANYVYVGGQGDGTARTIYEQGDAASIAKWGRKEAFVDASSAANTGELAQAATKALTEMGEKSSLGIRPVDTPALAYGVHYGLGDRVTAVMDEVGPDGDELLGDVITDLVRECSIKLAPDSTTITPAIGTDGGAVKPVKFLDQIDALKKRMNNRERG